MIMSYNKQIFIVRKNDNKPDKWVYIYNAYIR